LLALFASTRIKARAYALGWSSRRGLLNASLMDQQDISDERN
jgi:hypothetical protein